MPVTKHLRDIKEERTPPKSPCRKEALAARLHELRKMCLSLGI